MSDVPDFERAQGSGKGKTSPIVFACASFLPAKQQPEQVGQPLRCKAGEARCLIPWIADACRDFLGNSAEHRTATEAGKYLAQCYSCLSHEYFNRDKLSSSARKFVILYGSLASLHPDHLVWRCKLKLHIWLHLCEESLDSPALHWVYRDEDFGGTLAHIATRRGGANSPTAVSHMVLQMFYAKHQIPVLHGRE